MLVFWPCNCTCKVTRSLPIEQPKSRSSIVFHRITRISTVSSDDITKYLARFIQQARWEDIPNGVRHEAKRSILNFFGTALGGCRENAIEIALTSLAEFSDRSQATIIGRGERIDSLSAAFLNAASANIADFDDTHFPTVIHPTAPVVPALFSLAERRRLTGQDLLLAFILGVEVECRLGNAISPLHYRRGWHITATCGVFGAAAAAGNALALNEKQMVAALGNAATQSSGLIESLGTMAKSISIGNASRNGMWAALLAERGFTAPSRSLEGAHGFLRVMAENPNPDAILSGIGETWELSQNGYKPYPCGVVVNPVIDCCLALRELEGLVPGQIEQVLISGNALLAQRADRPDVATGREAQVSAQHSAAVTLLFGKPNLHSFTDSCVQDPDVRALRGRITLNVDLGLGVEAARVSVRSASGREHQIEVEHARGGSKKPLSDAELEEKFLLLASAWAPGRDMRPLIDRVWTLDRLANAAEILALVVSDR